MFQNTQMTLPTAGRILLRQLDGGAAAMVGLLHLPRSVQVVEGAAYTLAFGNGAIALSPAPLDAGLPEQCAAIGAGNLMTSCIWPRTTVPGVFVVRFLSAFPDQNAWTVVAAIPPGNVPPSLFPFDGHAWFDVSDGLVLSMPAPVRGYGMAMGSFLTQCPVWPAADGQLHTLPAMELPARADMHRYRKLLAAFARGEIDEPSLKQIARTELAHVASLILDPDYARHLAELEEMGSLRIDAPMSEAAFRQHNADHDAALRRVLMIESHEAA